jgi:hypothetical protein
MTLFWRGVDREPPAQSSTCPMADADDAMDVAPRGGRRGTAFTVAADPAARSDEKKQRRNARDRSRTQLKKVVLSWPASRCPGHF